MIFFHQNLTFQKRADPRTDTGFKNMFKRNPVVLKEFLNDILDEGPIEQVELADNEILRMNPQGKAKVERKNCSVFWSSKFIWRKYILQFRSPTLHYTLVPWLGTRSFIPNVQGTTSETDKIFFNCSIFQ